MGRDEKLVSLGFKGGLRFFRMDALADSSAYAWRVSLIHIFIRVIRGSRNGLVETINLAVRIYTLFIPLSCRLFNSWSHNRIFSWTFFPDLDSLQIKGPLPRSRRQISTTFLSAYAGHL